MKKLLSLALALALLLSLGASACAADKGYEKGASSVVTWTDSIGYMHAQVYFEIVNTSDVPLYCSAGKAELETEDGTLVKASSMLSCYPQIIEPGETCYYTDVLLLDSPVDGDLSLYAKPKVEPAKIKNLALDVTDVQFEDGSYSLKALGRVRNNTGEDVDGMIYVAVLLYGEGDVFLGCIYTILTEELEDGDRTAFEIGGLHLPRSLKADDIVSYRAFAYPYQFQF